MFFTFTSHQRKMSFYNHLFRSSASNQRCQVHRIAAFHLIAAFRCPMPTNDATCCSALYDSPWSSKTPAAAPVNEYDATLAIPHDIIRPDIPMDNRAVMNCVQGVERVLHVTTEAI